MRRTWWTLCLLAACTLPAALSGQAPEARRDSAVSKLRTGQQIRISAEGMQRLVGKAGVASNDTLDFAQQDMVRRIPIPAIDTVWVRGGAAKNGALIGAGAMLVFAGILFAEYQRYCESNCTPTATGVVGGIVFSGAFGASLGALIGGAVQSWKRTYP